MRALVSCYPCSVRKRAAVHYNTSIDVALRALLRRGRAGLEGAVDDGGDIGGVAAALELGLLANLLVRANAHARALLGRAGTEKRRAPGGDDLGQANAGRDVAHVLRGNGEGVGAIARAVATASPCTHTSAGQEPTGTRSAEETKAFRGIST